VDERDCRILMAIMRAPFDSMEAIGRSIGTSGTAAKARLDRMRAAGIYQGLVCGPTGRALGRTERLVVFGHGPSEVDLEALARVDEVAWAALSFPPASVAMLYREAPDAPLPPALANAAGRAPDAVIVRDDPHGHERGPLSPLDWRVIDALMEDPRASLRDLAEAAKLSPRTVRERRDALVSSGNLMAFPNVDATREEGVILYSASLTLDRADALRGLRLANAHRVATHQHPPGAHFLGYVRTYAEAHVVEEKLRATPGVSAVTFSIPQGTVVALERLRGWTRAQLQFWETARRRR
jgi:DNA-binding Lrp family transcriptional regulator